MTKAEHDKKLLRRIYDLFSNIESYQFQTEAGKEIGKGLVEGIQIIKPYMVELAKRIEE